MSEIVRETDKLPYNFLQYVIQLLFLSRLSTDQIKKVYFTLYHRSIRINSSQSTREYEEW